MCPNFTNSALGIARPQPWNKLLLDLIHCHTADSDSCRRLFIFGQLDCSTVWMCII